MHALYDIKQITNHQLRKNSLFSTIAQSLSLSLKIKTRIKMG